jgi:predicted nicotinamide N-methyase
MFGESRLLHLLEALPDQCAGFDVVLMSDLVFNHSQVRMLDPLTWGNVTCPQAPI